ncbi:MAG: ubiquitin-like protein Pup [Actinomycetaceae bacterium]|nr:ubiquitin-like protein Pup [Actinomycetaceae bacterium]
MKQEQIHPQGDPGEPFDEGAQAAGGQAQISTQHVDELLDEIDLLLETDAQSFVSGFVQKGGQ